VLKKVLLKYFKEHVVVRLAIFILCTFLLLRFSWRALKNRESHGFYRFFVFEAILVLGLLNQPYWFFEPFSLPQVFSWFFLLISIFFVLQALILLKKLGGYHERKNMPENFSFENTINIVTDGLYRYIRHPMYSSLLFLGWGAFLKNITPVTSVLVILVTLFLVVVAKVEENENIDFFGPTYVDYMRNTRMFIPLVF